MPRKDDAKTRNATIFFILILLLVASTATIFSNKERIVSTEIIDYSQFKKMAEEGSFSKVLFTTDSVIGYPIEEMAASQDSWREGAGYYKAIYMEDPSLIPLLERLEIPFAYEKDSTFSPMLIALFIYLAFPILLGMALYAYVKKQSKNAKGSSFKSIFEATPAGRIRAEKDTGIRFRDIAGEDESKSELVEIVDYLRNGDKYRKMGAKIPRGCLLVGPPGTGKTLLAKAVAGEANVPFFRVSGSDFVEMFVGVGASRVRELFSVAREKSPSIIFIDEIDAIGKIRGYGQAGGNDERDQTLNQLLVEMDGFESKDGVVVIAATNRPEILDPALLRPGRFDRHVHVDKPDVKGRLDILKIHTSELTLSSNVDLSRIARISSGLSGADLANLANEAALLAVRANRESIEHSDFEMAFEKAVAGLEKKNRVISERERQRISVHETGHALTAYATEGADHVEKISIIPRGGALGYTLQIPAEDKLILSQREIFATVDVLLGGRAAEDVIYGEISTGARNDIMKASEIVRDMLEKYGMSERFRNVSLESQDGGIRQHSEKTQEYIDSEIAEIISTRYSFVKGILEREKDALESISERLMENEVIEGDEFASMASALLNKNLS